MRYLIFVLALAGVVVSSLALRVHYSTDTAFCSINETWDCGMVNHSSYAEIAGVPVAAIGIAGYLVIGICALARLRLPVAVLSLGALGYSLYLTHVEKSVLMVWCLYCVISWGIITLTTGFAWWWAIATPPFPWRRSQKPSGARS